MGIGSGERPTSFTPIYVDIMRINQKPPYKRAVLAAQAPGGQWLSQFSIKALVEGGLGDNLILARVVPVAFLSCQFGGEEFLLT